MNDEHKLVELFAGSRSVAKVAKKMGIKTCSVDVVKFRGIDIVKDIIDLRAKDVPFIPTIAWASPLCNSYSIVQAGYHREQDLIPKTQLAVKSDLLVQHTIELFREWERLALIHGQPFYWFIENPLGLLRKMPFMQGLERTTVTYCRYGSKAMKPTDIWSNNIATIFNPDGWTPRPVCKRKTCRNHAKSPRGQTRRRLGLKPEPGAIESLNSSYERSKIPPALCREILESCIKQKQYV